MNIVLAVIISVALLAASHYLPLLASKHRGPLAGLITSVLGLIAVVSLLVATASASIPAVASIALLVRHAKNHYQDFDEARIRARGDAAIAAAEAHRPGEING